jgi:hypothetical protein
MVDPRTKQVVTKKSHGQFEQAGPVIQCTPRVSSSNKSTAANLKGQIVLL